MKNLFLSLILIAPSIAGAEVYQCSTPTGSNTVKVELIDREIKVQLANGDSFEGHATVSRFMKEQRRVVAYSLSTRHPSHYNSSLFMIEGEGSPSFELVSGAARFSCLSL